MIFTSNSAPDKLACDERITDRIGSHDRSAAAAGGPREKEDYRPGNGGVSAIAYRWRITNRNIEKVADGPGQAAGPGQRPRPVWCAAL